MWRHGDLLIEKVATIPATAKDTETSILAEGEVTGHAHRLTGATVLVDGDDRYFEVAEAATLTHEEHARIDFTPGLYRVTYQREYDPYEEAARRVAD